MKNFLSPWCAAHCGDIFVIEYLGEIETEFPNTLACFKFAVKTIYRFQRPPLLLSDNKMFFKFCIF